MLILSVSIITVGRRLRTKSNSYSIHTFLFGSQEVRFREHYGRKLNFLSSYLPLYCTNNF